MDGTELGFNPWTLKKEKVFISVELGAEVVGAVVVGTVVVGAVVVGAVVVGRELAASVADIAEGLGGNVD